MQIKLSDGRIEEATFKAVIERSGNSYAGWSMNWEDNVARDDKTHRSAKKTSPGK
jgi:regulator of RNase E activity RraB